MTELIDTHCHLYSDDFKEDIAAVIARSRANGVKSIYMPNIDQSSIGGMLALEKSYPGYCIPMLGLHPVYVKEDFEKQLTAMEKLLTERRFVAIGETGLDFYWDTQFSEQQFIALARQMEWAKNLGIPIILHCRKSLEETIHEVKQSQDGRLKGIFHCFSGSADQARQVIDLGFHLGIGGVLTFKNGGIDQLVKTIDPRRLVLETDAPYLAPVPHRGKRNEPGYLKLVAEKLSEVTETPWEQVAENTTRNAEELFGVAG
ncbi:TatD family hydrolase [Pollutibacter soli]|uniref:TatD family hydrolase n=1 Tax=Pollutibacter soli TaxID=3034157 RepID=UPI003013F928